MHARVYIGSGVTAGNPYHPAGGWYVVGSAMGPHLYANCSGVEEALDEWDERHGTRVDWETDRATLADYDGATIEEQVESAMMAGDLRMNDGGTTVWVDHYEWMRGPFRTLSDAMRAVGRTAL